MNTLSKEIFLNPDCATSDVIIVYADILSPELTEWLPTISQISHACRYAVAFRFWQIEDPPYGPSLQGFTAKATLKSTEYKVIDDTVFQTRLFSDCGYGDNRCRNENASHVGYLWPGTTPDEKTFTGIQALQYIHSKAQGDFGQALQFLRIFTEDGPSLTRTEEFLAGEYMDGHVEKRLFKPMKAFRQRIGEQNLFFINGQEFDVSSLKRDEEKLMDCLSGIASATAQLKVTATEQGHDELTLNNIQNTAADKKHSLRIGINFEELVPNSLVWFNDMFNDSRYKSWQALAPDNEADIKRFVDDVDKQSRQKVREGMEHTRLVKVRSDHLSLILAVDPADEQQFGYLSVPESVVRADLPLRVGLILVPNGKRSSMIAAAFHYLLRKKGRKTAVQFFSMIRQIMQYMGGGFQHVPITEHLIDLAFQQMVMDDPDEYNSAMAVLEGDVEVREKLKEAEEFAQRLNLLKNATTDDPGMNEEDGKKVSLLCLLNGVVVRDVAADIIPIAIAEQQRIASQLKTDGFSETKKGTSWFEQWVAADSDLIIINRLSQKMRNEQRRSGFRDGDDEIPTIRASQLFALRNEIRKLEYLGIELDSAGDQAFFVTVWLAATDHTTSVFQQSKSALQQLASSPIALRTKARFAIIPPDSPLSRVVLNCQSSQLCESEPTYAINGNRIPFSSVPDNDDLLAEIGFAYATQSLENGISGELQLQRQLHSQELESKCARPKGDAVGRDTVTLSQVEDAMNVQGMSAVTYVSTKMGSSENLKRPLCITAVVDPTLEDSYVTAALLGALRRAFSDDVVIIKLVIAPTLGSLKNNFDPPSTYRKLLLDSVPTFGQDTEQREPPRLDFSRLPQERVLTLDLEPPRPWFVSAYSTNYDMDNLILGDIAHESMELHVEYELKNLIVEGSCIDENQSPSQGLKLILENDDGVTVDTLVMANLGYFQLKVPTPGRWKARLAPGASSEIFSMQRMEMFKGGVRHVYHADSLGRVSIPVDSLSGAGGILLRVQRNSGMENRSVLAKDVPIGEEKEENSSLRKMWRTTIDKMYTRECRSPSECKTKNSAGLGQDTIHVFSVASGHLYERFLKIMISSVTKNASRPVKFWLLENYLSPSFKKVVPLFAKRHGAEIGMVTYKWPGWLRAQTEKQRIIWAYKVLFLDVLFPLDVERIIFVDSDQVIRGDLAELMDIDLKGAPYGYVPFCDSREEVAGYRFWKTGFWKDTLRGAKYRISALYVVDLNRFRETSAGDTLRYIYQTLSADPNSLSNLDQDLPNYASVAPTGDSVVPIYDLPQEWLWCESWCDDESKKEAKAIDLCNNPMTKEPKLASAKRIIPEWVDYDGAATKLTEELYLTFGENQKPETNNRHIEQQHSTKSNVKDEL